MKTRLFNWKNFLLLFVVIFVLYNILWALIEGDVVNGMLEYVYHPSYLLEDVITCLIFTGLSLLYSYIIYKVMPAMHNPYKRMIVNACVLFIVNNLTAIFFVNLFDHIDGGVSESLHLKGVYIYAMISAFVSSIYSNSMYMGSYIKASRELSAAIEKVKKSGKSVGDK